MPNCRQRRSRWTLFAVLSFAAVLQPMTAGAQTTLSSSAFGESLDLRLLPLLGGGIRIQSPPQAFAGGTAPPAFDNSASAVSVSLSTALTGTILSTGLLTAHAASVGPDAAGVTADATVHDARVRLTGLLPLLTLAADQIRSSASFSGSCAAGFAPSGSSELTRVTLGGSLGLGLTVSAATPPNTVLLDVAGIRVVLNEQIVASAGDVTTLTVNAVHIRLAGVLTATGLLAGDIILAQSRAEARCPVIEEEVEEADLAAAVAAPPSVAFFEPFSAEVGFTNQGPDPVPAVQLTVTVDGPAEIFTEPMGCSRDGATFTCTIDGPFASGESWGASFELMAAGVDTLTITASVSSELPDPDPSDNTAAAAVEVTYFPEG